MGLIDIDKDFARFVKTFRGGTILRDLIPDAPAMEPNADYYFPSNDILAELKCLRTDVSDQDQLNRRFLSACQRCGYSAAEALKIAFREQQLPRQVAQIVVSKTLNHVGDALRKANRQISATKHQLGRPDALGLVFVANERNTSNTPVEIIRFMASELTALKDENIDCVVYMAANLYYSIEDDGVGRSLWLPGYRRINRELTNFVDDLGAAWCRFREGLDKSLVPSTRTHEPSLTKLDVQPLKDV